ncbi:NHL repeat-containing protein [Plastoroseomonas hellenica]|uniref:peptidase n=1 Tax=Plastoroseomonas hellenica TaxID=2687306 RepID=UPI001BA5F95B|nr:peptidase [Plastoroseomonas hellenica]MBR0643773.1 peptidase [Plastoroseomonas hellenica]
MTRHVLFVRLGAQLYRIERPWGDVPAGVGAPSDVACDAEGRVYVQLRQDPYVGKDGPAVVVLAPDGRRIDAWGGEAVADGHMLSVHPDGRVFVVDRDAQEIIVFDRAGKRLGGIGKRHRPGEPFNAPCDVAFGADSTIYVADGYAASRIHRFSADGTPMGGWGTPGEGPGEFSTPHSVWVMEDGRLAVADRENNRVQVFAPDGTWLADWRNLHKPMSVHGAPDGGLYVTDQVPSLSLLGADGALLGRGRPVLNGAHGMWRAPDGCIYLSEQNPPRITRLVPVEG